MSGVAFLVDLKRLNIFINKKDGKLSVKGDKAALTSEIKQQLGASKEQILALYDTLNIQSNRQLAPVSFSQQRLWFYDQLNGGSYEYNIRFSLRLDTEVCIASLNKTFNYMLNRHEALRTVFVEDEGQPYQLTRDLVPQTIEFVDLSHLEPEAQQAQLAELVKQEALTSFKLDRDLMIRSKLVHLNNTSHVLMYTLHHIATDGSSMTILANELSTIYEAFSNGNTPQLAPLSIQYSDYAQWQRHYFKDEVYQEHIDFWQDKLDGIPNVHSLPLDHPRQESKTRSGASYNVQLSKRLADKFNQYCKDQSATTFMGLYSLLAIVIGRYSGEKDVVLGTPIANREQAGVEQLIGFFVNTIVLRNNLASADNFQQLLLQNRDYAFDAFKYQQLPFDTLINTLKVNRANNYDPIFQIMLAFQNTEKPDESIGISGDQVGQHQTVTSLFDLTVNITESDLGTRFNWVFNPDLFDISSITRMAQSYLNILEAVVEQPTLALDQLPLINDAERVEILQLKSSTRIRQ